MNEYIILAIIVAHDMIVRTGLLSILIKEMPLGTKSKVIQIT